MLHGLAFQPSQKLRRPLNIINASKRPSSSYPHQRWFLCSRYMIHTGIENQYHTFGYILQSKIAYFGDFLKISLPLLCQVISIRESPRPFLHGISWYNMFSGKHFCYFDHLSKRIQTQVIPHLKALL